MSMMMSPQLNYHMNNLYSNIAELNHDIPCESEVCIFRVRMYHFYIK